MRIARYPTRPIAYRSTSFASLCFMQSIGAASPHLAVFTDEELKAGAGSRKHVYPQSHPTNAGERSLTAIVNHFEPMWKSGIQCGNYLLVCVHTTPI